MADQIDVQALQVRERIAVATAGAMFVAGVLLMAVILPAEYGVDPLGTGNLFGLTQIAQAEESATAAAASGGETLVARPGANISEEGRYRQNTITFTLGPREGIEYKYHMDKDAGMVYRWEATDEVGFEFHGEPEGAPQGYADTYEKGEARAGNGTFFAPSTGIHGWWWENLGTDEIKVTITADGFFTGATEFRATGRTEHEIPQGE